MQTPDASARASTKAAVKAAAVAVPTPDSYVVRLSGGFAALLGRTEGAEMNRTRCWTGCGRPGT